MRKMYFDDIDEFEEYQKKLFKKGYSWNSMGKNLLSRSLFKGEIILYIRYGVLTYSMPSTFRDNLSLLKMEAKERKEKKLICNLFDNLINNL